MTSHLGVSLSKKGEYFTGGECMLYPQRDCYDWGCFKAKYVKPAKENNNEEIEKLLIDNGGILKSYYDYTAYSDMLFYIDSITNAVRGVVNDTAAYDCVITTGTQLMITHQEPMFNIGDVVVLVDNLGVIVDNVKYPEYQLTLQNTIAHQKSLEIHLATAKEIYKWNDTELHNHHLHYDVFKRKIIYWFNDFEHVIARDTKSNGIWQLDIFRKYDSNMLTDYHYECIGGTYDECIPYTEKTKLLVNTDKDYGEEV